MASISSRLNNLKKNVSSILSVSRVRGNPPAKIRTRDLWMQRTVRITQEVSALSNVAIGALVAELGWTDTCNIKIRKIRIWNATGPATTTNYLFAETGAALTINSDRCEAQDYGSGSQLAGLEFTIPGPIQKGNGAAPLQTTTILSIAPSATQTTTAVQSIVMDFDVLVNLSADGS